MFFFLALACGKKHELFGVVMKLSPNRFRTLWVTVGSKENST